MTDWSRWSNTVDLRKSFGGFLAEGGTYMSGDPNEIAQQNGWTGDNFGWYRDKSGQVVARAIGGKMVVYNQDPKMGGQTGQGMQTDMGNPAVTAGQKPADRARTMGLQSNGRGGYIDPDTGQVKARTVNGELVFYDDNGGAVSDGAGGMALTQSSPSWVDPVSGLILVPPAQPESPNEAAAVPDPVPASSPMGYDKFINDRHRELYRRDKIQREIESELQDKEMEILSLYSVNDESSKWYETFSEKIKNATQNEDEYISGTGSLAQQMIEDNAEEYSDAFETVAPEEREELGKLLTAMIVSTSRANWFNDNVIRSIEEDESLDDDERLEQMSIAYADPRSVAVDRYGSIQKKFRDYVGESKQREVDKMIDVEARNFEGEYVTYTISKPDESMIDLKKLTSTAKKTLKKLDIEPNKIVDVTWNTNDEYQDEGERVKAAHDALKTWRNSVLPSLEVGTILTNTPSEGGSRDNQRERIYKLAGFGDFDEKLNTQPGIVIDDMGEKKVIPIKGASRSTRLKESLCDVISNNQYEVVYELLEEYVK